MTISKAPPAVSALALARSAKAGLLRPMQPALIDQPFDSDEHIFELKWGGVRALAFIEGHSLTLIGANGRDITEWYPELHSLPDQVKGSTAVLDGEIVAVGKEGYPSFDVLRERFKAFGMKPPPEVPDAQGGGLCYQVYDMLLAGGRNLMNRRLWHRKDVLNSLVIPSEAVQVSDFIDGEGVAFYEAALEHKLEGIIAKWKESEYRAGERSDDWQELRILEAGDFVIGGYTFGGPLRPGRRSPRVQGRREPFSELLIGAYDREGNLRHVGNVSGPFTLGEAGLIFDFLSEQHTSECPFVEPPEMQKFIHWCRPELVCRVRFSQWTREGKLRFPVFLVLRPDLTAADCVAEDL
ncbi:MAG: hypothetical protein WEB00_14815 [Dehalococcoidia bacterium]